MPLLDQIQPKPSTQYFHRCNQIFISIYSTHWKRNSRAPLLLEIKVILSSQCTGNFVFMWDLFSFYLTNVSVLCFSFLVILVCFDNALKQNKNEREYVTLIWVNAHGFMDMAFQEVSNETNEFLMIRFYMFFFSLEPETISCAAGVLSYLTPIGYQCPRKRLHHIF